MYNDLLQENSMLDITTESNMANSILIKSSIEPGWYPVSFYQPGDNFVPKYQALAPEATIKIYNQILTNNSNVTQIVVVVNDHFALAPMADVFKNGVMQYLSDTVLAITPSAEPEIILLGDDSFFPDGDEI